MIESCLFIGGPLDGKVRSVNTDLEVIQVDVSYNSINYTNTDLFQRVWYRQEQFVGPNRRKYTVYFFPESRKDDPMQALIEGYAELGRKVAGYEENMKRMRN